MPTISSPLKNATTTAERIDKNERRVPLFCSKGSKGLTEKSISQEEENLTYQREEFEKAWQEEVEDQGSKKRERSESGYFSSSSASTRSPRKISSTYTTDLSSWTFDESMEANWLNNGGFAPLDESSENNFNLSPGDDANFAADFLGSDTFGLDWMATEDDVWGEIEKGKGAVLVDGLDGGEDVKPVFHGASEMLKRDLGGQPQYIVSPAIVQTQSVLPMVAPLPMNTRGSHQRKVSPGQRVVAASPAYSPQSPQQERDVKPDQKALALGVNNGQSRKRPASVGKDSSKKPRKYEIDDTNDPSVRNAKAAKMNRDRKKQEYEMMQNRAQSAETRVKELQEEIESIKIKYNDLEAKFLDENKKNRTITGLQQQMTNMKTLFESILPAVSQTFGKQVSVEVPDSFAQIPAVVGENGQFSITASPALENIGGENEAMLNAGEFNILDPAYQMMEEVPGPSSATTSAADSSEYITLHINPNAGKIKLSYDPSKLIRKIHSYFDQSRADSVSDME